MSTESADYRKGFAAGRDDARSQMDALYDQNYQLESELNQLRVRAQSLEATLVLTEDQRDKALKERDTLREQLNDLQAGMRQWEDEHASAVVRVIAERDALRAELHHERQQHASTREILRAMERGNT